MVQAILITHCYWTLHKEIQGQSRSTNGTTMSSRVLICEVLRITGSRDANNLHWWYVCTCLTHSHLLWVATQFTTIFCPGSASSCTSTVTLIFKSCQKLSGCYNNVDFCNNKNWHKCKLISDLPTSCVLITGNVACCNAGQHWIKFLKLKRDM
jgi:hypothetical protein